MFLQVLMSWIVKLYSSTTLLITRATGNISIHQFSKERIRTESHLFFKILVSSITLNCRVSSIKSFGNRIFRHKRKRFVRCRTLEAIIISIQSEKSINVVRSINFDIFFALVNINTTVVINQT